MSLTLEDAARLGGSDVAGILGLSPWSTPLSIYVRVVAALEGRSLPDADSAPKHRGRHLEAAVLRLYAEETGAEVFAAKRVVHPGMSFGRASLDALVRRDGRRVAEAKTAGMSMVRHWGEPGTDQIPQGYLLQCTWYGGVASKCGAVDTPDVDVAALVGGDLRIYVVRFDAELFSMLEASLERFWVDHVLPRRPPPVTEPLRDADAVGALYPRHSGDERHWETLQTEEQRVVIAYLGARAIRIAAQMAEVHAEAELKLLLKDTSKVYGLPASTGARSISWKRNKDGTATDWEQVARDLASALQRPERYGEVVKLHTTTKEGARPLRVTAAKEEE